MLVKQTFDFIDNMRCSSDVGVLVVRYNTHFACDHLVAQSMCETTLPRRIIILKLHRNCDKDRVVEATILYLLKCID